MEGGGEGDPIISEPPSAFVSRDNLNHDDANPSPFCPPGMGPLNATELIVVQTQKEMLKVFTGYELNHKYRILDSSGKPMFYAVEKTGGCTRFCLCCERPFKMAVLNGMGSQVLRVERRPSFCCCFGFGQCCNEVRILSGVGDPLGKISQHCGLCSCICPSFTIRDSHNHVRLRLKCCTPCLCCIAKMQIHAADGKHIGELTNGWGGFGRDEPTIATDFGATFPIDLEPLDKTLLMAALLTIDVLSSRGSK